MKLLVLASALDLNYRLGCTPSWWQLLKALHETGNDIIAIPYLGNPTQTLWWRTYPNPCSLESRLYNRLLDGNPGHIKRKPGGSSIAARILIQRYIRPKWKKHLRRVLQRERDVDAILMLSMPVNHFTGIPTAISDEFGVKVAFYEGDMPTILPQYATDRGFKFSYYEDADLSEYDVFFSNSKGVIPTIRSMGARNVHPLYWAADPTLFYPLDIEKDYDISFYGHGDELREEWMTNLISKPSEVLSNARFVVGGGGFGIPLGRAELVGSVPYDGFSRFVSRSRINLNITRHSHTRTYASATSRPFELAACGACIVSQPYDGIEEWFTKGKELFVVSTDEEIAETYKWLLGDEDAREQSGRRAQERVLNEHTFRHRAYQIVETVRSA